MYGTQGFTAGVFTPPSEELGYSETVHIFRSPLRVAGLCLYGFKSTYLRYIQALEKTLKPENPLRSAREGTFPCHISQNATSSTSSDATGSTASPIPVVPRSLPPASLTMSTIMIPIVAPRLLARSFRATWAGCLCRWCWLWLQKWSWAAFGCRGQFRFEEWPGTGWGFHSRGACCGACCFLRIFFGFALLCKLALLLLSLDVLEHQRTVPVIKVFQESLNVIHRNWHDFRPWEKLPMRTILFDILVELDDFSVRTYQDGFPLAAGQTKPWSTHRSAGVWSNTYGCTGSGNADNLTPATSFRSHSLLSARSDAQQLCSSGRWYPCSIPLETRSDSLPESTNQLTPAFGAAVAIDGSRPTSLTALGPLTNLHSLHVMSPVSSFPQQNPQLGATSESWWSFTVSWSWRALTCASCCSILDETGRSSDVLYTVENSLGRCLTGTWRPTAFTSNTRGFLWNRTRFMPTLDPSELEVTLGCFFAMHATLDWGPSDMVRRSSPSPSSLELGS